MKLLEGSQVTSLIRALKTRIQEGSDLKGMTVTLSQTVKPSDGQPTLPVGEYEVTALRWLSHRLFASSKEGPATFVVTAGPHAGTRRRIGVVKLDLGVVKLDLGPDQSDVDTVLKPIQAEIVRAWFDREQIKHLRRRPP